MADNNYDVIILGAGAIGSAAAYHAAKAGHRVLLLEQFEIDHQHGSSHGLSRIIRYAYDHPAYVELARASFPLWIAFQEEAGETLYVKTGGIDFAPADTTIIQNVERALTVTGIPFEKHDAAEARKRFPQFRFDDDMTIIYQADTGLLAASKCVLAHIRLAQRHGATICENTPVTHITVRSDSVEVKTPGATYPAARLIVAAGGWAKPLLAALGIDLPLSVMRTQENYFSVVPDEDFAPGCFPVFIAWMQHKYGFAPYGIPSYQNAGLKIGIHGGPVFQHPSEVDRTPDPSVIDLAQRFAGDHIPGGVAPLRYARACLYTMTPDEHFIIDRHPEYAHVVISSSCSGHGFKFGTLIGSILCDLAFAGSTPHDISLFTIARFSQTG